MAFRPLDLSRPIDLDVIRRASENVTIRGLFLTDYVKELNALGVEWPHRIVAFKQYPSTELVTLVSRLAETKYKEKPVREAWFEIASCQYPLLRDSLVGRVVFGALGNDVSSVMKIANKGYAIASSELGPVRTLELSDGRAVIELERQAMPIEGWHAGVFAGAVTAMKRKPTKLAVDLSDELNGRLEICWS